MNILRQPLSMPLAFTIMVMLGLSFVIVINGLRVWGEVQRVTSRSELIATVGHFVHELQIERGLSAFYLGSQGDKAVTDLLSQRVETDINKARFEQTASGVLRGEEEAISPATMTSIRRDLDKLADIRKAVIANETEDEKSFSYYSALIERMFTLQNELSENLTQKELRERIVRLRELSWIKERTGQIRALGAEGFASGRLTAQNYRLLVQLIGVQNDRQAELDARLTPPLRQRQETIKFQPEMEALRGLQDFLLDDGMDGNLRKDDAAPWFNAMTTHINRIKDLEDELTDDLMQTSIDLRREMSLKFFGLVALLATVLAMSVGSLWREQRKAARARNDLESSLQTEQVRSQQILESMTDAVCVVEQSGTIQYANPAMLTAFGAETLLRNASEVMPCCGTPGCALTQGGLMQAGQKCDEAISPLTGRGYSIHCAPFHSQDGQESRLVVMTDVTTHIMAEQRLLEAKNAAESANQTKSSLLANMSHELRTPLNAIIGFSDVMVNNIFGELGNERYRECASDIHGSGLHLLDLINDILDVSAIEAGKVELHNEDMDINEVVNVAVRLVISRAEKGGVDLCTNLSENVPLLFGDVRRMKQIALNLLSNAVKFTPEAGTVTVRTTEDENGAVALIVEDTGAGMTEGEVEKAMEPFGQADSGLNRKHEGTGLGLPLTRGLVELHGGKLRIVSIKGGGTIVTVKFPPERAVVRPEGETGGAVGAAGTGGTGGDDVGDGLTCV